MGGFFAAALKEECIFDLFFGTDYHSHLGTRRAGMTVYGKDGFNRSIHSIESSPFRTKFQSEINEMQGNMGIGCISDYDPQPLIVRSHHGTYSIMAIGKINNMDALVEEVFKGANTHFLEMRDKVVDLVKSVCQLKIVLLRRAAEAERIDIVNNGIMDPMHGNTSF